VKAASAEQGSELHVNRVIAVPPGSDQASSAVRYLMELRRQGTTASIIVGGTVLNRYVRSLLPFEARGRGVIVYQYYLQKVWRSALGSPYAWTDDYNLDLWEFRSQLTTVGSRRIVQQEHAVVLHGQQFPIEFYELLRLLSIPTTVYVDSTAVVGDDGSTINELTYTLGVSTPSALWEEALTTTSIYDFFSHLNTVTSGLRSSRPNCVGEKPLLWHHDTVDDEAQFIADYATENARASIGLVVPLADMVTAFRKLLTTMLGEKVQWHLAHPHPPRAQQIDFRTPGVKILTWASALGVRFDTVILGGLHYADYGQSALRLATTLQILAASARRQLFLSYSGSGEPPSLNFVPRHLLELREEPPRAKEDAHLSSRAHTDVIAPSAPVHPISSAQFPSRLAQRSAIEIARSLLAESWNRKGARRVLTAEEEVGLAQLMRGPDADLSIELLHGFRGTVAADDERAIAFDAMVTHNDGLVWSIVRTYAGAGMAEEDLYQNGILGLMRAIEKFDATLGTKFSTYGTWWIRQAITRGIANEREMIRLPVHVLEAINKVTMARERLFSQRGHASIAAISQEVGFEPDKVAEYLRLSVGVISLDIPLREDKDFSIADLVTVDSGELTSIDETIDRQIMIRRVREALDCINARDALVLRLRFGFDGEDELTLDQIGRKLGLTRERIRQIEKKAKIKLLYKLTHLDVKTDASHDVEQPAPRLEPPPAPRRVLRRVPTTTRPSPELPREEGFYVERLGNGVAAGSRRELRGNSSIVAYNLKTWLLELIDQGLTSHASQIAIRSNHVGALSWLTFVYDGEPSIWETIQGCMLPSRTKESMVTQLRRAFGSAINLFDEMIVWPPSAIGDAQKPMVLATARKTDSWWLFEGAGLPPPAAQKACYSERCSAVAFRGPVRDQSTITVEATFASLRADLGLTIGDLLLADRVSLTLGDQRVTPRDPFLGCNPAAQDLGFEQVTAGGHSALVNPRVLPHPEKLLSGESYSAGNPATWERTQGFYIRCAKRYLSCGGWLGLAGLDATTATSLARVAVEIQPEERAAWGLTHSGQAATPPEPLRRRLTALAGLARKRSEQVLAASPWTC
jgi:RNA polymerase primary sigma factor